jgi:hypothetical protein
MSRILRGLNVLLVTALLCAVPARAFAQVTVGGGIGIGIGSNVGIAVNFGPPPLPYYVQPPCPQQNYIWMPGYWAWGDAGYYWVPGTWVPAPQTGYLWTPGYWANNGPNYGWNAGYWAPQVGFYGGINYGYGYYGNGYQGGSWQGNRFRYNTAVTNVNTNYVHNVYVNRTVVNNNFNNPGYNRVSYNGGNGGVQARPNASQQAVLRDHRLPPTSLQQQHIQTAAGDRNLYASVNKGRPSRSPLRQTASRPTTPPCVRKISRLRKPMSSATLRRRPRSTRLK